MDDIKQKISPLILGLIEKTSEDYRDFASAESDHDPKSFATHHSACKAALQHLHLLIRIFDWTEGNGAGGSAASSTDDLAVLVEEARAAIGACSNSNGLLDEEGDL